MYIINVGNGRIFNTDTLQMISVCYESLAATLAGFRSACEKSLNGIISKG